MKHSYHIFAFISASFLFFSGCFKHDPVNATFTEIVTPLPGTDTTTNHTSTIQWNPSSVSDWMLIRTRIVNGNVRLEGTNGASNAWMEGAAISGRSFNFAGAGNVVLSYNVTAHGGAIFSSISTDNGAAWVPLHSISGASTRVNVELTSLLHKNSPVVKFRFDFRAFVTAGQPYSLTLSNVSLASRR